MVTVSVLSETPMSEGKRLIRVSFRGLTNDLTTQMSQRQALAKACKGLKLDTALSRDEEGCFILVFEPGLSDEAQLYADGVFEESFLSELRKKHNWVSSYRAGKEPQ